MRRSLVWPQRLRGVVDSVSDRRLAALLAACTEASDPSDAAIRNAARAALQRGTAPAGSHIGATLRGRLAEVSVLLGWRRTLVALGLVLVAQLGFALGSDLGRRSLDDVRSWFRSQFAPPGLPPASSPAPTPAPAPAPALSSVLEVQAPPPLASPGAPPSDRIARRRRIAHAPAPPVADALAAEAGMLSRALALLDTDPARALAQLDDYHRTFPTGALRGEAALAELRAHQALGQPRAALAALDRLAAEGEVPAGGSAGELRTSRLELMADAGRCAEALGALDSELVAATSRRLEGRLLLVRAACRARTGDAAGSKGDLYQYLALLPEGPRAAEVRRRLNEGD